MMSGYQNQPENEEASWYDDNGERWRMGDIGCVDEEAS